jgi:hypothetical protein
LLESVPELLLRVHDALFAETPNGLGAKENDLNFRAKVKSRLRYDELQRSLRNEAIVTRDIEGKAAR